MRVSAGLMVVLLLLVACQKEELNLAPEGSFEIASTHTQQKYEIQVVLPKDYDEGKEYPVLYLLDGYYHFNDVGELLGKEKYLEDLILVGVFYKDYPFSLGNLGKIEELREIDLTYPVHLTASGTELGGGGLKFYDFLHTELVPYIDATYATAADNRTLMGHSLSGYFCLFQMMEFQGNPTFHKVVALSPSLWWSNLEVIEQEEALYTAGAALPFKLYMGIGEQEGVEANALVDELGARLEAHQHLGLEFEVERYNGGHLFSAKKGFQKGLKYLFE